MTPPVCYLRNFSKFLETDSSTVLPITKLFSRIRRLVIAFVLRKASHNILYAVANSNSVNAEVLGYKMELWLIALIVIDCAVVAAKRAL